LSSARKSSVLALDFLHSLFGFGRGGDTGGVDPPADPAASSRDIFFPAAVFMLFDGDGFILQRQRVFTRIRLGAAEEANSGGTRGITVYSAVAACAVRLCLGQIYLNQLRMRRMENPKGFGFYV
jgi:hypothetical protein